MMLEQIMRAGIIGMMPLKYQQLCHVSRMRSIEANTLKRSPEMKSSEDIEGGGGLKFIYISDDLAAYWPRRGSIIGHDGALI